MQIGIYEKWDHYLTQFPDHLCDIYFREAYAKLYTTDIDKPLCVVVEDDDFVLLLPILRRAIENGFDFETPYGYGGPIFNINDPQRISIAIEAMHDYLKANHYLAGFIRFHPQLNNSVVCEKHFAVVVDRMTVAIDTSLSVEEIWENEINSKGRGKIKKCQRRNLTFIADEEFVYLDNFVELYTSTMKKLSAEEFYYFDRLYFKQFIEKLKGQSFIGVVKDRELIISAAIFLYQPPYGHYHLSGSDFNYLHLNPNDFLLFEAAKELKKRNVTKFHLGGGSNSSENNSLWEFKKKFSRNYYQFSIGKWVFNQEKYNQICEKWSINNPDKVEKYTHHLLKYRY